MNNEQIASTIRDSAIRSITDAVGRLLDARQIRTGIDFSKRDRHAIQTLATQAAINVINEATQPNRKDPK